MKRLAWCIGSITAAVVACVFVRDRRRAARPVPVKQAAAMLREAWADHHTMA
jgi:hypothetical protein